jgi:RNA polymerase sigma-70 factor, ECF subfamily
LERKFSFLISIADYPLLHPEQAQPGDLELLNAIARGDEQALESLYNRYRLILFGLILRILHSRAEAEDVLQESFVQVWQKAKDFDEMRGRPFTWLVTIARSRAIDRLRALGARDRLAVGVANEASEEVGNAVSDAILTERGEIVRSALSELPEDQRQVLLLAYFDGFTQSEIAKRLNTPLGTVKTRMRSGMMKLREMLGDSVKLMN